MDIQEAIIRRFTGTATPGVTQEATFMDGVVTLTLADIAGRGTLTIAHGNLSSLAAFLTALSETLGEPEPVIVVPEPDPEDEEVPLPDQIQPEAGGASDAS
jgi:hypothetical protein